MGLRPAGWALRGPSAACLDTAGRTSPIIALKGLYVAVQSDGYAIGQRGEVHPNLIHTRIVALQPCWVLSVELSLCEFSGFLQPAVRRRTTQSDRMLGNAVGASCQYNNLRTLRYLSIVHPSTSLTDNPPLYRVASELVHGSRSDTIHLYTVDVTD